jgi:hypothetical protein
MFIYIYKQFTVCTKSQKIQSALRLEAEKYGCRTSPPAISYFTEPLPFLSLWFLEMPPLFLPRCQFSLNTTVIGLTSYLRHGDMAEKAGAAGVAA